jgi:hypothetical protein
MDKIDDQAFQKSLQTTTAIQNPADSGATLYKTTDHLYCMKSLKPNEIVFLESLMPKLFEHHRSGRSFLPRFYDILTKQKQDFIVMKNIIPGVFKNLLKFDLKGSKGSNRFAKGFPDTTGRDINFLQRYPHGIKLNDEERFEMLVILTRDCTFLERNNIMDYSLLLGITSTCTHAEDVRSQERRPVEPLIGIIDILNEYNKFKGWEHGLKSLFTPKANISVCPPKEYRERFLRFILGDVFPQI